MKIICKDCGEFKERGYKGLCKICYARKWRLDNAEKVKMIHKKWYLANPEKAKAKSRKRYKDNPEKMKAGMKKYRLENREKIAERMKKYRLENREKIAERMKEYRLENREKIAERMKEYRANNLKKLTAYDRKWHGKYYLANSEKVKTANRKWRVENPGKAREINLRRHGYGVPKKGVVDRIINENLLKYGFITCEQCKEPCGDDFHIDHVLPVSRGGGNEYSNLQILCAKHNLEKHTKTIDYREEGRGNQLYLKG